MGYCNPPLGDIKKCDHRELRVGASKKYEESVCQCDEGDIGWFVGRGTRKKVEVREGEYTYIREGISHTKSCLLYTSPSPRDATLSRMPSSA